MSGSKALWVRVLDASLSRIEVQQQADAWTQADYERSTAAATLGYTFTEAFPALVSEADVMTVTYYST